MTRTIAEQIVRLRAKRTQENFARELGISVRTLQNWEQGRRAPRGPALALLAGRGGKIRGGRFVG